MKKMYVLLVALLVMMLLSDELKSQTSELQWEKLNTGTDADIRGIASIGTDTIIACGSSGTIIKSVDSGRTWQPKNSGTGFGCMDIKFANHEVGYIVAGQKNLLKTVDGGETWMKVLSSKNSISIDKLFLVDADTLYLKSYVDDSDKQSKVIKSINGGMTWVDNFICPAAEEGGVSDEVFLTQLFFTDNVGYIVVTGSCAFDIFAYKHVVYKSVNFGKTWSSIIDFQSYWTAPPEQMLKFREPISAMFFDTANSGIFYTAGASFSTKDGFETYIGKNSNLMYVGSHVSNSHLSTQFQKNGNHCVASYSFSDEYPSYSTVMQYSNDNGKSWITGKEMTTYNYHMGDPISEVFLTAHRVTDSIFYIGCNGGILRSPTFPVGVNENKELDVNIYPNPVFSEFRIDSEDLKIGTIDIFDMVGKRITNINGGDNAVVNVNISELKTGVYFVKIATEQGDIIKKITKQ